jgi:GTPase SAR1 family protein
MIETRKLIFIGPPGSGKTTIKKVFFDMTNPFKLLETPLEPTRGINSRLYSFFNLKIGVFDLAGQENKNWFGQDKDIFNDANIIICVIDVNSYIKEIFEFLKNLNGLYRKKSFNQSNFILFFHKIDLSDKLYLQHKVKTLQDFLEKENIEIFKNKIYTTSIAKDFFFDTYDIIADLFTMIIKKRFLKLDKLIFENFRTDLKILLQYNDLKKHKAIDLSHDFNLSIKNAIFHIRRLVHLGFVKFLEKDQSFKLTQRSKFFNFNLKNKAIQDEIKINKVLESMYIFSNIKLNELDK